MTQEIKIFEGPVANVKTTKRDGSPMVTSRGGTYIEVGFKNPDGSWLNLTAFDAAHFEALQPGNVVKVGYTEEPRLDGFGQPKLYQGAPQFYRNVTAVQMLTGATQTPQNGAPSAQGTNAPAKAPYNAELGAFQTALNGSVAIEAALITAKVAKEFDMDTVLERAAGFHRYLTTGKTNELDQAMHAAKDAGLTEEPPIGFDDPPEPDGSEEFGF